MAYATFRIALCQSERTTRGEGLGRQRSFEKPRVPGKGGAPEESRTPKNRQKIATELPSARAKIQQVIGYREEVQRRFQRLLERE